SNNVTFNANVDVTENNVSVKSETFEIDRSDWNMVYNAEGSEGVPLDYIISDDIELAISFSVAK
ncbi:MAG: lipopolysaccharide export system protein LptA, partial [Flavobacteriales bacterium]